MKGLILLIVGVSLIMFTYMLLPVQLKNRKRAMLIGISLYLVFFALAVSYNNASTTEKIGITNIDLKEQGSEVNSDAEKKEAPIELVWEPESEIFLNNVLNLKLTVKNNSDKDLKYISLKFPKAQLTEYFSISSVKPSVNVNGDKIGLGGIKKKTSKEFIFELWPKKSGLYSEDVVLIMDNETNVIDGQEISSRLQLKVQSNN